MICSMLSLAAVLSQPPHPPPFTYYYADVTSTLTYPNGRTQHGKGIAAYDSKVTNKSAWIGSGSTFVADFNKQIA